MNSSEVCSKDYRRVLVATHGSMKGWGPGGKRWADIVTAFAAELGGVQTILDYGCGQGTLKGGLDGEFFEVKEYDPGIPHKSTMPEPADLVVCTDVLEHVEPELIYNVLTHIKHLGTKGSFLVIACHKANNVLVDGRNAHLIIMPPTWWLAQLERVGFKVLRHEFDKTLRVWCHG